MFYIRIVFIYISLCYITYIGLGSCLVAVAMLTVV